MLICQCCFAIVKVLLKKVIYLLRCQRMKRRTVVRDSCRWSAPVYCSARASWTVAEHRCLCVMCGWQLAMASSARPSARRTAAGVAKTTSVCLAATTVTVNCASARVARRVDSSRSTVPPSVPSATNSASVSSTPAAGRYVQPIWYIKISRYQLYSNCIIYA